MNCPNKANPQYKELSGIYGEGKALGLWRKNGEESPTPLEAMKTLYGNKVQPNDLLKPWNLGSYDGKDQATYEPEIDALIKKNPNAKIGGGESFNQIKNRSIEAARNILESTPANSVVVSHSSVIKFIMEWDKMGRPDNLDELTPGKYLAISTNPGESFVLQGTNGSVTFLRHGSTQDNASGKLRTDDTKLTTKGESEAESIGKKLSNQVIPLLYTSPLNRTLHTTELIMSEQKKPVERYSDIKLQEPIREDFSHIVDFTERYNTIAKRKAELQQQGAQISNLGSNGFSWIPSINTKEKYNQLTNLKNIKHELQSIVEGTIHKGQQSRIIQSALSNIRRGEEASRDVTTEEERTAKYIKAKTGQFIKSLGGRINYVSNILHEGHVIPANAQVDVINRTIDVVEGREQIDTLPEEAAHVYTYWLPGNSVLRRDMLKTIRTRPEYDMVMEQYSNNPQYQHPDGTVDEEKIAMESIGKVIAGVIVGKVKDQQAKSWWQKMLSWLKGIFKGKNYDAFDVAASDIIGGSTKNLDIAAIKAANSKGEIYYQLSEEDQKLVDKQLKNATAEQKEVVEKLIVNPENKVVLEPQAHIYTDTKGEVYQSTTSRIGGKVDLGDQYEINRLWGNDMDKVLQAVIMKQPISKVQTPTLSDEMRDELALDMAGYIAQLTADGSIAFTQVTVATPYNPDPANRVAGSIDLLVVHPNGEVSVVDLKTSWDSITSSKYTTAHQVGEGSALSVDGKNPSISKKVKHSIQVGSYAKMLTLAGYNVRDTQTKHILLHTQGGKVLEYEDEGVVQHEDSENRTYIDKVIPGVWQGKQAVEDSNPLHDEHAPTEEELEDKVADTRKELEKRVIDLFNTTKEWKEVLQQQRSNTAFKPRQESIEAIDMLLSAAQVEFSNNADYSTAYTVFLDSAIAQLDKMLPYISKKDSEGNLVNGHRAEFLHTVALAAEYINTYKGLYHTEEFATPAQDKKYRKLDRLLRETGIAIEAAQQYMADKAIDKTSVNPAIKNLLKDAEWDNLQYVSGYGVGQDIGATHTMMGSVGGNTILDITQKKISNAQETARENADHNIHILHEAANKLKAAGVEDYNFMMDTDDKGEWTGHVVTNIGSTYTKLRADVENPLQDTITGERYQYKNIKDESTASEEDIEYNKDLYGKKQAYRRFMSAEDIEIDAQTGEVYVNQGMYHKYIDGFIKERDIYMYVDVDVYGNAKWKFRSTKGMSAAIEQKLKEKYPNNTKEEAWKLECNIWRNNHYNYSPYETLVRDKKGNPTGVIRKVSGDSAWFPKSELVEPRLKAKDGTKLAPEKYYKLMTPQTVQEHAQSEYYNTYIKTMQDMIAKLPAEATYWWQKGNVPSILANTLDMMADKGADKMAILMSQMKNILPKAHIAGSGEIIAKKNIPVALMNSIQDTNRLQALEQELQNIVANKSSVSEATYDKRYKEATEAINAEKKKLSASKLHKDLTLGLEAFIKMAESYDAMSNIEQELLNMESKILNMKFEQEVGLTGSQKKIVSGADSRTYERYKYFLDNEFYNEDSFNKTMLDYVIDKLMNATSAAAIGFNMTGMINNAFVASLNNSIESWGSDFFRRESYRRMQKLFTTEMMPGYIKTLGQYNSRNKNSAFYGEKKAGSKYEALVHHFNMINHQHDIHNGKVSWLAKFGGYLGYEAGEYMVQSQIGLSVLDSVMFKNDKGEELSGYDVFDWDADKDKLTVKPGYTISSEQKHDLTHRIWKTNERVHGNYRWKIMLQKYTVGRLALQFHKWVYPNYRQRFQKMQFDEALGGGMDVEGRYTTLWHFSKSILALKSRAAAYNKLTQLQKNNLKKDLADALYVSVLIGAYYIIKKLADGIPDDDPYLKKMANWMSKEADRGSQELSIFMPGWGLLESYRLVKSPIAVTNSLMKFVTIMTDISHMPFQDHENWYYQKGVFKGQLKVSKDVKDIVPLLREINEWYRLDQQSNFFIR